jgi:hypothetical protein
MAREEPEDKRYFVHFSDKLELKEVIVGPRFPYRACEIPAAMASYCGAGCHHQSSALAHIVRGGGKLGRFHELTALLTRRAVSFGMAHNRWRPNFAGTAVRSCK